MKLEEVQELAREKGIALTHTRADLIAALDELEPSVSHAGLSGKALADSLKWFKIPRARSKRELKKLIQVTPDS